MPYKRHTCALNTSSSHFASQQLLLPAPRTAPGYKRTQGPLRARLLGDGLQGREERGPPPLRLHQTPPVSFDPFATESTAVREAWRQLTSPTLTAANPKCKVEVVSARGVAPAMEAEFVDGDKRPIVASGAAANLVGELYRTAHSISLDYALKGKPPPT